MPSDLFIQQLKQYSDIEQIVSSYVPLKKHGRYLSGLCPFHSEKTPSFYVYPQTQSFYCFGCGAGGDVITFVRQIENLEYMEAVRFLADRCGLTVPEEGEVDKRAQLKKRVLEINRETARFYFDCLMSAQGKQAYDYLIRRGRDRKTIRHFGLGYSPNEWGSLVNHLKSKGFSESEMVEANVAVRGKNGGVYDRFRNRVMFPIIDLRGNPGGLVTAVCDTLRQILPEGLIVYTEDKNGKREEYTCDGDTPISIPLVVLVNENTASAAEIFTGAVKDYGIGTIVGTTTFGKGIVQNTFQLSDGSVVKLTIAHYYTPLGNDIHKVGTTPDVEVELPDDATSDVQLEKALEVVKGLESAE